MKKHYPMKTFRNMYHIGTLNTADKKRNSHEGAGLSFSTHPDAWKKITPLFGDVYRLEKENHAFLDYYRLSEEQKNSIYAWGKEAGYLVEGVIYRVEYYDDEWEQMMVMEFANEEEAKEEAEENEIQKMKRFVPLQKMKKKTKSNVDLVLLFDLLCTLFAEEVLAIDGVWWQDELDVSRYSAPRGVIVPSKVNTWTFQKENKKDFIE